MAMERFERAAIDHAAVARHQNSGAVLLVLFVAILSIVLWGGVSAATHLPHAWVAIFVGLAIGFTVRLAGIQPYMGARLIAVVMTLLASVAGCFASACLAQDMMPLMVLAHWGPVGQQVVEAHVFAGPSLAFDASAVVIAIVLSVVRRPVHHAR
jgi:hypothetical protein